MTACRRGEAVAGGQRINAGIARGMLEKSTSAALFRAIGAGAYLTMPRRCSAESSDYQGEAGRLRGGGSIGVAAAWLLSRKSSIMLAISRRCI